MPAPAGVSPPFCMQRSDEKKRAVGGGIGEGWRDRGVREVLPDGGTEGERGQGARDGRTRWEGEQEGR